MGQELRLEVHVQPGSSRDQVIGVREGVLWVKVAAPAEKGAANERLREVLAWYLEVRKGDVVVVRGATSRKKIVAISGIEQEQLARRLAGSI